MSEQGNKPPEAPKRDEHGRLLPGNTANPSGRPKKLKEFREKLEAEFYDEAFIVMRSCLADDDGRVRIAALKELWDRMFGKAPQAITGPDGENLKVDLVSLVGSLKRLAGEDEPEPT